MSLPWQKKLFLTARLIIKGDGYEKADILKKQNIFGAFGNRIYWFTRNIPSDPEQVYLHDNIKIATGVYFCTHDIIDLMLNDNMSAISDLKNATGKNAFARKKGKIEIHDNVFLGANCTIMYNVEIGSNVIVAANSVVTKSVPPNSIVAGNPAKIIGSFDDFLKKRIDENRL